MGQFIIIINSSVPQNSITLFSCMVHDPCIPLRPLLPWQEYWVVLLDLLGGPERFPPMTRSVWVRVGFFLIFGAAVQHAAPYL